ncbi:Zn-dependent hydrolase [Mesobaculum littorinae]|uniref:Zn-dependent hydrolase n=1 Tax=Mesobaculum littorinae TaxID=2486419 RepID=A0A438AF92_9RHOB|nr:Zn-dependent hydrolase [Mesobaculum littorinae]RVV97393.1 Zn-dependent hydrolase [Mesobaculum littorinae]
MTDLPRLDDHALAARLLDEVAAMSPDTAGVSRPAFSALETRVLDHLSAAARGLGLAVDTDAGGNRVFRLPGDSTPGARHILIGSHVDSVPQGGNFDGLAGVVAGLLVLARLRRSSQRPPLPVRVIAMRGEESAWFGPCYIASKLLTGAITADELGSTHRGDGRPLSAHIAECGIAGAAPGRALADLSNVATYLELHIEQGPLLVEKGIPAATVTGIRGNFRHRAARCLGEAGHSGAVPRAYRHDPVMGFAELMHRLDETWDQTLQRGGDLVLTCGILGTDPDRHAIARIPGELTFSLDIRSQSADTLVAMKELLHRDISEIEAARGLRFDLGPEIPAAPAMMDPDVVMGLESAMARAGQDPFLMPSGGGHDAAVFAQAGIPAGMVFVRNRNGSHNPDEAMEVADLIAGTDILSHYVTDPAR